jgi:hypothetical protein
MTAAAEFDVPKSIPMTLAIFFLLCILFQTEAGGASAPEQPRKTATRFLPVCLSIKTCLEMSTQDPRSIPCDGEQRRT